MRETRVVYQFSDEARGRAEFQAALPASFHEFCPDMQCEFIQKKVFPIEDEPGKDIVRTAWLAELEMQTATTPECCVYVAPRMYTVGPQKIYSVIFAVRDNTKLLGTFTDFPYRLYVPNDFQQYISIEEYTANRYLFSCDPPPSVDQHLRNRLCAALQKTYDLASQLGYREVEPMTRH